jgi:outer membrane protein assembly factor BamB
VVDAPTGVAMPFRRNNRGSVWLRLASAVLLFWMTSAGLFAGSEGSKEPILLVVLDPLSKELACACVKGYGQRDYRKLAARLAEATRERVSIEFSDDLAESMNGVRPGREVIIIGGNSSVALGAHKAELKCHPICELTGLDGQTTLTASFVVRSDDPASELKSIKGRSIIFGLGEAEAELEAASKALREAGVEVSPTLEKRSTYSDAALDMIDSPLSPPPVAVIPSYALRLLEGCGSVKPGSLKVLGTTQPLPFITVFLGDGFTPEKAEKVLKSLLSIKTDAKLLKSMESRDGFVPVTTKPPLKPSQSGKPQAGSGSAWPDWRGPGRDGHVARLPRRLPATPAYLWKKAAMSGCLAGLSVSGERLILAERDFGEEHDVYRCLNAGNGDLLWRIQFEARGKLDYGQSPRATPVIQNGKAYLLGAFGGLRCVNVADGRIIWERHLPLEFKAPLPTWGMCSTPLVFENLLVVNPGATNASLAALDCITGRTRWTTPGLPAAYSAFICGEFGRRRQLVGYDQRSLGGWDLTTGKRLWQLVPANEGDFNVPTPIAVDDGLLLATENNGTRLYRFDSAGRIISAPAAEFADLSPSTVSPVVTCGRIFGAQPGLSCLDLKNGLKQVWHREDDALGDHVSLFADDERVLVVTLGGELILLDAKADHCEILSRLRLFEGEVEVYSHPALMGTRLYARGGSTVMCVDLGTN